MAYRYDIFVSYRRDPEALLWLSQHFVPILKSRVSQELPHTITTFVHEVTAQIPAGTAWPVELGETIGQSRILVALWSGNYLASEWCCQELALMLDREAKVKARTVANKFGLVIPVIVHDGESIPGKLANAQHLEIKECFNSRMPVQGAKAEILADRIGIHAAGIAAAIKAAPPWRKEWPKKASQQLIRAFERQQPSQRKLPRFGRP